MIVSTFSGIYNIVRQTSYMSNSMRKNSTICLLHNYIGLVSTIRLIRASSLLASLELLQIPVTNLHVASVFIHALGEISSIDFAVYRLLSELFLLNRSSGYFRRGRAAEKARHTVGKSMANSRTNSHTGSSTGHLSKQARLLSANGSRRMSSGGSRRRRCSSRRGRSSHGVRGSGLLPRSRSSGGSSSGHGFNLAKFVCCLKLEMQGNVKKLTSGG